MATDGLLPVWQHARMSNYLKQWRESRGLTLEKVGDGIRTDKTQVSKLEKGDRKLSTDWLDRFAKFYKVPAAALLGPPASSADGKIIQPRLGRLGPPIAYISEVNVEASAGAGAIVDSESAEHVWAFPDYWLRAQMGAGAADVKIITVRGDSGMSDPPKATDINPGDKVLVNIADKRPSPPGMFVVFDGLGLVAKRLEYIAKSDPPRVRVLSNNPAYAGYESDLDAVTIQGRIVAKFQRLS